MMPRIVPLFTSRLFIHMVVQVLRCSTGSVCRLRMQRWGELHCWPWILFRRPGCVLVKAVARRNPTACYPRCPSGGTT
jgi:hypothetical protein